MNLSRLRWINYVLRIASTRLSFRALYYGPTTEWKKPCICHQMTCQRWIRRRTANLGKSIASCLFGFGLSSSQLETLKDLETNRELWRLCCHSLSNPNVSKIAFVQLHCAPHVGCCSIFIFSHLRGYTPCSVCMFTLLMETCGLLCSLSRSIERKKLLFNPDARLR